MEKQNATATYVSSEGKLDSVADGSLKRRSMKPEEVLREDTIDLLKARRDLDFNNAERKARVGRCRRQLTKLGKDFMYFVTRKWNENFLSQFVILFVLLLGLMMGCAPIVMFGRMLDGAFIGGYEYEAEQPYCYPDCPTQEYMHFLENVWVAWAFIADPGTHADQATWSRRVTAFIVAMVGVIYMSIMIGFVSNAMMDYAEALKLGTTSVEEFDHVLILGWSSSTLPLVEELCTAAASEKGGVIVILAETVKAEIEQAIDVHLRRKIVPGFRNALRGTRIVVRTGSYSTISKLELSKAHLAKSIIVQAASGDSDKADSLVLRTILSLKGMPVPCKGYIVAEMRDIDNQMLVKTVGGDNIETIVSHDIIGRLMIKSARVPGLAEVYESVLGFDGCEFYMENWPELTGMRWADLYKVFECLKGKQYEGGAIPMGIHRSKVTEHDLEEEKKQEFANKAKAGFLASSKKKPLLIGKKEHKMEDWQKANVMLNPDADTVIMEGDEIIVLAADDDSYTVDMKALNSMQSLNKQASMLQEDDIAEQEKPELILMCGWRRDLDDIIVLLNELAPAGSELHMLSTVPLEERNGKLEDGGLLMEDAEKNEVCEQSHSTVGEPAHNYTLRKDLDAKGKPGLKLVHWYGNAAVRRHLREVEMHILRRNGETDEKKMDGMGALCNFDSVLILADESLEAEPMNSDSHVLASLLLIRELQREYSRVRQKNSFQTSMHHVFGRAKMLDQDCIITCEILDPRTRGIISNNDAISAASDYILSTHIVSKVLAMVAERKEIYDVLNSLLGPNGAEITLLPVYEYARRPTRLSFRELQARVAHKGGILLGFQQFSDQNVAGELVLSPKDVTSKRLWLPTDSLITLQGRINDLTFINHFNMEDTKKKKKKKKKKSIDNN